MYVYSFWFTDFIGMAQGITTSSFYGRRIRITDERIVRERRNVGVIVPDPYESEVEDDENEDEVESFKIMERVVESDAEVEMTGDEDQDPDFNISVELLDQERTEEDEGIAEAASTESYHSKKNQNEGQKSGKNKKDPVLRWRKKTPVEMKTAYIGEPLPEPPQDEMTTLQYFKLFFDDELIHHIVDQTNLYSVQKTGTSVNTSESELEQYLGILLMMGVIILPQYRMYWSTETNIPAVSNAISVNRFDKIKRFFHCNNNENSVPRGSPNYDKLFKVRPVINAVLDNCKKIPPEEKYSIDEQMIPTKCRSGIVYDSRVYTGAGSGTTADELSSQNLGVGGNVVKHLTSSLQKNVGHKVYFDNYFSSVNLMQYLMKEGIWAVGTIRADRLKGAGKLLQDKKDLAKKGRGSSDWCVDANSNISIVRWLDNGILQLISNYIGKNDGMPAQRWSAKEKN